jgi:hypothetical protein
MRCGVRCGSAVPLSHLWLWTVRHFSRLRASRFAAFRQSLQWEECRHGRGSSGSMTRNSVSGFVSPQRVQDLVSPIGYPEQHVTVARGADGAPASQRLAAELATNVDLIVSEERAVHRVLEHRERHSDGLIA